MGVSGRAHGTRTRQPIPDSVTSASRPVAPSRLAPACSRETRTIASPFAISLRAPGARSSRGSRGTGGPACRLPARGFPTRRRAVQATPWIGEQREKEDRRERVFWTQIDRSRQLWFAPCDRSKTTTRGWRMDVSRSTRPEATEIYLREIRIALSSRWPIRNQARTFPLALVPRGRLVYRRSRSIGNSLD